MKITIFGAGYVGLVTAACLSETGNEICCVDVNAERIANLKKGICPIHEPGLAEILQRNTASGRLYFETDPKVGVDFGTYIFIAVGTPQDEDGSADLRYVLEVARSIGKYLDDYRIVIDKSTVPVGTADRVRKTIASVLKERGIHSDFDVVSNPEFLREGAAIKDFMNSDRIIVGVDTPRASSAMKLLYNPFDRNHDRLILMDIRSAELTKYAANAFLATKISFINEVSNLAERLGADVDQIRIGIGSDPRIGYHFINPGCGYGGSCFPKDVSALEKMAELLNYDMPLIKAVSQVNQRQKHILFEKIKSYFKDQLKGKVIALWGLAFKPNTDDMREAPSRYLIESLWKEGAKVRAYDPVAMTEARRIYGERQDFVLCQNAIQTLEGADALAIVTEWNVFSSPDFEVLKQSLSHPVIFDGRNLYDPALMKQNGFSYFAIGRGETCLV
ncbi:MAG: UDP-glucose 6-dehydrogenase [Gammaproteobacteria bacterium RIFCSPLOWO2_02_FULL_38_11]|nr:MAG: UDP-glucose 6-dehydrogenase [Gammaproteobacteria bacterium RIFCSPHIGHO2_12_38_15]OGT68119.1 MAG: UDP-glucose 6-dehydrogenase [Gammaproteobacteria bacterium RIFCSPLOWO2_02_FULL_38_11]